MSREKPLPTWLQLKNFLTASPVALARSLTPLSDLELPSLTTQLLDLFLCTFQATSSLFIANHGSI